VTANNNFPRQLSSANQPHQLLKMSLLLFSSPSRFYRSDQFEDFFYPRTRSFSLFDDDDFFNVVPLACGRQASFRPTSAQFVATKRSCGDCSSCECGQKRQKSDKTETPEGKTEATKEVEMTESINNNNNNNNNENDNNEESDTPNTNSALANFFSPSGALSFWSAPKFAVTNNDKEVLVKAQLPEGLAKENVNVEFNEEDGFLTISAEHRNEKKDSENYYESSYGHFSQSVPVPKGVTSDAIKAKFDTETRTLQISFPKPAEPEPQPKEAAKITID